MNEIYFVGLSLVVLVGILLITIQVKQKASADKEIKKIWSSIGNKVTNEELDWTNKHIEALIKYLNVYIERRPARLEAVDRKESGGGGGDA